MAACQPSNKILDESPGGLTFKKNCQACHRLPNPSIKSDEEWPAIVKRYGEKAKLNQEQIAVLTEWLIANN